MKIFIILMSLPIFCAQISSTNNPFMRINEETSTYETAYKSYISADQKTIIQLIGMEHNALPEFYKAVENMSKGKVVIYELVGHSLEDEKKQYDRVMLLGDDYSNKWQAIYKIGYPDALGLVYQIAVLSYKGSAELIHADKHYFNINAFINQSDDKIKEIIDDKIYQLLKRYGAPDYISPNEFEQYLPLLPALSAAEKSSKELSKKIRQDTQEGLLDLDLVSLGKSPVGYLLKKFGKRWQEVLHERNEIIFDALKKLWSRSEIPNNIAVIYGAGHLLFVEDFLLKNGYQPISGSNGWLMAAKLCPSRNDSDNKCIKRVYLSKDESMIIYLIGNPANTIFSARDKWFVKSRILGLEKSLKGDIVEIAYTPDDIDYVAENLLRNDFILTSETSFTRNNNRKRYCITICKHGYSLGVVGDNMAKAIGNDF